MRINHSIAGADLPAPSLKAKIFIATPSYDARVSGRYSIDLAKTVLELYQNDISCELRQTWHMAHSPARNTLVKEFLETDCTHILFIDEDQGWDTSKIIELIKCNELFVAAAVRFKTDNEEYPLVLHTEMDGSLIYGSNGLVRAHQIGVALALIKRECFDLVKKSNELKRTVDCGYEFFNFHIKNVEYQGEDNDFCEKCRNAGIPIYIYPNFDTKHIGFKTFEANFNTFCRKFPGGDLYEGD